MAQKALSDDDCLAAVKAKEEFGTVAAASRATGINRLTLTHRIGEAERRGISANFNPDEAWTFPRERQLWINTGTLVIFSDAHIWPNVRSVAMDALPKVIRKVKPRAIIANGDIVDGVSTSRHAPFGWAARPTVKQEIDACVDYLAEIERSAPKGCDLLWSVGNHDIRFERTLAVQAKEFAGMFGFRLSDHFPSWEIAWSVPVNAASAHPVMVKHRNAGGVHAGYNNTMKGGLSIVTGHTHILEVKPWADYRGRRWGIQSGTLADLHGPQFEYHENGPSPACSGFVVLTFRDGNLCPPELCEVIDGTAWFRGEIVAGEGA